MRSTLLLLLGVCLAAAAASELSPLDRAQIDGWEQHLRSNLDSSSVKARLSTPGRARKTASTLPPVNQRPANAYVASIAIMVCDAAAGATVTSDYFQTAPMVPDATLGLSLRSTGLVFDSINLLGGQLLPSGERVFYDMKGFNLCQAGTPSNYTAAFATRLANGVYGNFDLVIPSYATVLTFSLAIELTGSSNVVSTLLSSQSLFYCLAPLPADCIQRNLTLGSRRFKYTISTLPDGKYVASGSLPVWASTYGARTLAILSSTVNNALLGVPTAQLSVGWGYTRADLITYPASPSDSDLEAASDQVVAINADTLVLFNPLAEQPTVTSLLAKFNARSYTPQNGLLGQGAFGSPLLTADPNAVDYCNTAPWDVNLQGADYDTVNTPTNFDPWPQNGTHHTPAIFNDALMAYTQLGSFAGTLGAVTAVGPLTIVKAFERQRTISAFSIAALGPQAAANAVSIALIQTTFPSMNGLVDLSQGVTKPASRVDAQMRDTVGTFVKFTPPTLQGAGSYQQMRTFKQRAPTVEHAFASLEMVPAAGVIAALSWIAQILIENAAKAAIESGIALKTRNSARKVGKTCAVWNYYWWVTFASLAQSIGIWSGLEFMFLSIYETNAQAGFDTIRYAKATTAAAIFITFAGVLTSFLLMFHTIGTMRSESGNAVRASNTGTDTRGSTYSTTGGSDGRPDRGWRIRCVRACGSALSWSSLWRVLLACAVYVSTIIAVFFVMYSGWSTSATKSLSAGNIGLAIAALLIIASPTLWWYFHLRESRYKWGSAVFMAGALVAFGLAMLTGMTLTRTANPIAPDADKTVVEIINVAFCVATVGVALYISIRWLGASIGAAQSVNRHLQIKLEEQIDENAAISARAEVARTANSASDWLPLWPECPVIKLKPTEMFYQNYLRAFGSTHGDYVLPGEAKTSEVPFSRVESAHHHSSPSVPALHTPESKQVELSRRPHDSRTPMPVAIRTFSPEIPRGVEVFREDPFCSEMLLRITTMQMNEMNFQVIRHLERYTRCFPKDMNILSRPEHIRAAIEQVAAVKRVIEAEWRKTLAARPPSGASFPCTEVNVTADKQRAMQDTIDKMTHFHGQTYEQMQLSIEANTQPVISRNAFDSIYRELLGLMKTTDFSTLCSREYRTQYNMCLNVLAAKRQYENAEREEKQRNLRRQAGIVQPAVIARDEGSLKTQAGGQKAPDSENQREMLAAINDALPTSPPAAGQEPSARTE